MSSAGDSKGKRNRVEEVTGHSKGMPRNDTLGSASRSSSCAICYLVDAGAYSPEIASHPAHRANTEARARNTVAPSSADRNRELGTFWKSARIELLTLIAPYPCKSTAVSGSLDKLVIIVIYMAPSPQEAGRSHATSRLGVLKAARLTSILAGRGSHQQLPTRGRSPRGAISELPTSLTNTGDGSRRPSVRRRLVPVQY